MGVFLLTNHDTLHYHWLKNTHHPSADMLDKDDLTRRLTMAMGIRGIAIVHKEQRYKIQEYYFPIYLFLFIYTKIIVKTIIE